MRNLVMIAGIALMVSHSASASPLSDATAGLKALESQDYQRAVELLSKAIDSKQLGHNDLELAYVKRAQAYILLNDPVNAAMDAGQAELLDGRDPDAVDVCGRARDVAGNSGDVPVLRQVSVYCRAQSLSDD